MPDRKQEERAVLGSHQPIRSFVRREGRLTSSQKRALVELWPRFGLDYSAQPLVLDAVFNRAPQGQRILEIGFGNGEVLAQLAGENPNNDYLGIEVHRPGVGHLLQLLVENGIQNTRVISHDAVEVLERQLPAACLDQVLLFFPDPWPKKRHHKRRILRPDFVDLLASRLKSGGLLHAATDWQNYAESMLEVLDGSRDFSNLAGKGNYSQRPASRPETKFERRGKRLGHDVWDLLYRRR